MSPSASPAPSEQPIASEHTDANDQSRTDEQLVLKATELVNQGDLDQAEALLRGLIDANCSLPMAWMNLGVIVGERGDKRERMQLLQRARELDPTNSSILLNLATAHQDEGEPSHAESLIRDVLSRDEHLVQAHHNLGVVLAKQGRQDEARTAFTKALELDPVHLPSLDQLTELKSAEDLKLAESGYRSLIAMEPNNNDIYRKLAVNLTHQNRINEAIECYRKALDLCGSDGGSMIGLGLILLNQGQADESLVLFLQALALDPDDADALACNGLALHNLGDQGQAVEMLDRALLKMPERVDILNVKGQSHQEMGQLDQALACFEKANKIDPRDMGVRYNITSTLMLRGDLE